MRRCYSCMEEYKDIYDMCPHCGYEWGSEPELMYFLMPGTVIGDRYEIGLSVGHGGFGITYKAWDKTLSQVVAIKEYYPTGLANRIPGETEVIICSGAMGKDFENGKIHFLEEAQNMAKYNKHPNIVNVFDFFEENNTAYIVMEFLDGINYKDYIKQQGGIVRVDEAVQITKSILVALAEVHKNNVVHRDISPDNIFVCKDGKVKLIDFGAARFSSIDEARTRSIILKHGYAPPEQYQTKSKQGPWTDLYALGATLYRAITGIVPEESVNRVEEDLLTEPKELCPEISENLNNTIMRAMALQPELRFQNSTEFLKALESTSKVLDVKRELRKRKLSRIFAVTGVCAVVLAGVFICLNLVEQKKVAAGMLEEANVSIWVEIDDEQSFEDEKNSFEAALSEFRQEYPQITLDIQYYDENSYDIAWQKALKEGNLPTLFESNGIGDNEQKYLEDLSKVFQYIDKNDYFFLEDYDNYYPSKKQIPLAFNVPVVYRNTVIEPGKTIEELIDAGNYLVTTDNYFTYHNLYSGSEKVTDFKTVNTIEAHNKVDSQKSKEQFISSEKACLISDISDYEFVQQNLAGIYEVHILETDGIVGKFHDCFSINQEAAKEEKAAAIQVLVYLLADTAQDIRYVQGGCYLPINASVYESYVEINQEFKDLENGFSGVIMPGENQGLLDNWYEEFLGE